MIHREGEIWRRVGGEWRPLYGGIEHRGCSVEIHRFRLRQPLAWHESFHPDTMEVCLNVEGRAVLENRRGRALLREKMVAIYFPGNDGLEATREAGEGHAFLTVEITRKYLLDQLGKEPRLQPWVRAFLDGHPESAGPARLEAMPAAFYRAMEEWAHPPVLQAAQDCWFRARVLDLAALYFFAPEEPEGELFCSRQKRVARERMEKARAVLDEDLVNPPRVDEIARRIGCSPGYLSRIFSAEAGMTMPQYLRQRRLERAAELLRAGTHNVTEAAFEVGYNSLSHFSKAFWEAYGCCPGLYPHGMNGFDSEKARPRP